MRTSAKYECFQGVLPMICISDARCELRHCDLEPFSIRFEIRPVHLVNMASLRTPPRITQALCSACNCALRIRNFTSTTTRTAQAMKSANVSMKQMTGQLTSMKSLKSEMKNATRSQLPDDFGLMPQTFVLPKREELPSIFAKPGRWWKIFYNVQKMKMMRVFGLASLLY